MAMDDHRRFRFEDISFLVLVVVVTLAFSWLVAPYFSAILWGIVAAILFAPLYNRLLRRLNGRANLAAGLTLLLIVAVVIVPAIGLGMALVNEAATFYQRIESGQIDFARILLRLQTGLPEWATNLLRRSGFASLAEARATLSAGISTALQAIAAQALSFGQGAFKFIASLGVMLYLTYFLLRDGEAVRTRVTEAIPLRAAQRDALVRNFTVVIRATVKGSIVVGILQGLVGGLVLWALGIQGALLWGVLMGVFSLVPAVGTGLIWVPMAVYLLATGSMWEGAVLVFCGIFVIGLIDNLLRPVLVGHDTRMPDFVVLISTLAGLELFGLSGFIVGPTIAALFMAVWTILTAARADWDTGEPPSAA